MAEQLRRGPSTTRRVTGFAARAAIMLVLDALLLWGLSEIVSGISVPSFGAALLTAAVIALLNAILWPVITRLALPFTLLTLGLGSLVLNALVIELAFKLVDNKSPSFAGALLVAAGLALAGMLITPLLDFDGDAYHLRVVRRRVRRGRAGNETDVPGVVLFEFDGLGEEVLREAVRNGYAPTIARWLEQGSHRVVGWECDLSSQTGASQAGLLLGSNWDMPAFRWYEKESGRTLVSNHPPDAAEIERRHSTGGGLLAAGGTSRGNMFSGDAPRCSATMSMIRDRKRSRSGDFFAYFADPYGFIRTIALSLADIAEERLAARRQKRSGAEHVEAHRRLPPRARGDRGRHARHDGRDADGRHRRGHPGDLRDICRLRRGRAPLGHSRAGRAQSAAPPRPSARPARARDRAGAAARITWSRCPTTARRRAAPSASVTATPSRRSSRGRSRAATCARRRPLRSRGATWGPCSPTPARTKAPAATCCAAQRAGGRWREPSRSDPTAMPSASARRRARATSS